MQQNNNPYFFFVETIGEIVGCESVRAVRGRITKERSHERDASGSGQLYEWDSIPKPINLAGKLAWPKDAVESWVKRKVEQAISQAEPHQQTRRRPGRPRKSLRSE